MRFLSRNTNYIISVQILSSYCYECSAVVHLLAAHEVSIYTKLSSPYTCICVVLYCVNILTRRPDTTLSES